MNENLANEKVMKESDWQRKQVASLWQHVSYTKKRSKFYKDNWKALAHLTEDAFTQEIFAQLPFTTKADLSKYNEDFRCVDRHAIADYVTTSGTTGDPITFYLTGQDLDRLAKNEAQSMKVAGASSSDVFQLITTKIGRAHV